jgi:uncharacterized Zn-finger protein
MPPSDPANIGPPPPEILMVRSHRLSCDGGGVLGHPRVYMEMGERGYVECPYCDRRFVLEGREEPENERLDPGDHQGSAKT